MFSTNKTQVANRDRVEVSGPDSWSLTWQSNAFTAGPPLTFWTSLQFSVHPQRVLLEPLSVSLSFLLLLSLSCSLPLIFQILCPGFPSPAHLPQSLLVFFLPSSYSCFLSQLMSHFLRELSLTPDFDLFSVLKHVSFGSTNHHFIEIIFVLWIFLRLDISWQLST